MNFFRGSIAEAVAEAKLRKAIFAVFVEGPNESSKQMAALIDSESIRRELESSKYVAIRIQSETEAYTQFADIYKLVPLPSIFFLSDNGTPRAIVTEVTKTVAELEAIIQSVQLPADGPSSAASSSVDEASGAAAAAATTSAGETNASVSERMRRAQELIDVKRKEHEAEQQRLEKERELERRQAGQDLRSFKERQTELELKQLREERQRDKLAEQAIRKRILDQIAQDRATNAARFANSEVSQTANTPVVAPAAPRVFTGTEARIQFRKPDGSLVAHEFLASDAFQVVRDYVANELLGGRSSNFTLASSFPRRLFSEQDADMSLVQLDLAPTAVILVQSSDKALQGNANPSPAGASSAVRGAAAAVSRLNVLALVQSAFWTLMVPVLAVVGYLRNLVGRGGGGTRDAGVLKRENEERVSDNDAAKRRNLRFLSDQRPSTSAAAATNEAQQQTASTTSAYKRPSGTSNIHRLRETQDSDDETNTWNGNSTQQQ